ncbi:thiamine pyrophosphate-dependent enzyme [Amycolatopsis vancoresmycina]|uniref:Pyruvate/2-oxoglutarate dehydrogenase E1 component subunit alpha n=1 Tax=Amycolatopsis vancoresmycina DSM 44592 TaxID=1292037 RepID=R1H0F9_9PSEU|nr:thiamine pyrophosphate-dependent enzyme [Amycolatopsis vancoresmycina]EOD57180.1 pyruvate/2-oxoglutarate dehydrogenase E1 component subunit alpha [Amycolatopsis vancoresmycina DSM 44592]
MTDALRGAYRVMCTIRAFEERVHQEFASGERPGRRTTGEEAAAAGVCLHLDGRDVIAGAHRRHGHRIAKGVDLRAVLAEIRGRRTRVADGTLGGVSLLVCGAALAAKQQHNGGVGVAFLSDGAGHPGTTSEALDLACAWNLPAIFVAEDSGYADRVAALGMPGVVVDGADFFAVHEAAGEAIDRARGGGGPTLMEITPGEGGFERFRTRVTDSGELAEQVLDDIDADVAKLIEDSLATMTTAPDDPQTDVYIIY